MSLAEAKALSVPEYLAFAHEMDKDLREQRRAQRKRATKHR